MVSEGPQPGRPLGAAGSAAREQEVPVARFVVVDDVSTPATSALHVSAIAAFAARMCEAGRPHRIELVSSPAKDGKGSAVRRGWGDAATGVHLP